MRLLQRGRSNTDQLICLDEATKDCHSDEFSNWVNERLGWT